MSTASTNFAPPTYAEIAANGALVLIAVASSLLKRQLATLEKNFVEEGGFTERLYRVRTANRKRSTK
jgi:four helix bundle suffix protein